MKRRVKQFCLWILVVAGIFGGVFGCILGSNVAWADPIRQTVKNGDSYIVVENTTRNNPEITITVEKDDGNNNNSGETIKVQPSNPNVYKLDDGSNSDNVLNSMTGQSSISSTVDGNKVNENSGETMDCDELLDEYADGGIGAMQWILCPTMNNTAYTADWVDYITQDMLEIKADTYTGLGSAWGAVRNIANIAMTVFLLIVIFSQVTGYGIDNYGIKKMLPRLVVMAIVINLSLYICQIAVDLSNILGTGLRDMFGGMVGSPSGGANFVTGAIIGIFSSAGSAVSAGVSAAAIGAGGWGAVVIAIVVLVLVIIVALVILWLMIAARQIIVIFCIIISPLAFAAFILPNTQNLFKKWVELFKAALIIFPICGAVSGISAMIRSLADQGKFDLGIAGSMILMVLPFLVFFLLPSLLKQAISALGKLGGALTSVGNTVRSGGKALGQGAMHGIRNSERMKNIQEENARRRQERYAQNILNRTKAREEAGRPLSERDKRRKLQAQQTLNKLTMENAMVEAGVPVVTEELAGLRATSAKEAQEFKNYTDQYGVLTRAQMGDELGKAVSAYDADRSEGNALRLQAAIASAESRGMNQEMLNYVGGYHKDENGNDNLNNPLLRLSANNANDAKILSRLSSSSNKVISQYGIQMSKEANRGQNLSMGEFASSTGPVKMSEAFDKKGPAILNNMDDDTLEYINKAGANAARLTGAAISTPVVSTAMLANAAASTTNQKELKQINDMLSNANVSDISFSGKQLANFNDSTVETLMRKINTSGNGGKVLQQKFVAATNDIERSPELMGTLRPEQRKLFNDVRRSAGLAEMGTQPQQSQQPLQ